MDVLNLSRVFGPTLVGHSSANPTPLAIMEDTPRQCKVVARLLSLPPSFWRGFVDTEQENLVPMPALGGERGEHRSPSPHPPWPLASFKCPGCPCLNLFLWGELPTHDRHIQSSQVLEMGQDLPGSCRQQIVQG
uniref:Rho-GAP domain-containing protein n=1 Tax=Serinus canaria TaxID=9135 RepID=A0A8C9NLS6_SERCA